MSLQVTRDKDFIVAVYLISKTRTVVRGKIFANLNECLSLKKVISFRLLGS